MANNAEIKLVEGVSQKTNKPYTSLVIYVDGQEVHRTFPSALELIGIKSLLNI